MRGLCASLSLPPHCGQLVVLKRNRRRLHDGFVNGALARVESVHANGAGKVTSVVVSLLDEGASGARACACSARSCNGRMEGRTMSDCGSTRTELRDTSHFYAAVKWGAVKTSEVFPQ